MDELDFEYLSTFPDGDPAGKALVFLKAGISTFAKKNYRDEPTLKLIVAALTQAPLLVPVGVDFDELLGGLNPEELSPDQELHPKSGSKPTWVTARLGDGTEVIPMFIRNVPRHITYIQKTSRTGAAAQAGEDMDVYGRTR